MAEKFDWNQFETVAPVQAAAPEAAFDWGQFQTPVKMAGQPTSETVGTGQFPKENLGQLISRLGQGTLPYAGMTVGGVLGTPADIATGPAGTIAGAGLGYAGGQSLADLISSSIGQPASIPITGDNLVDLASLVLGTAQNFNEGAIGELGGRAAGVPINYGLNKAAGIVNSSAVQNIRDALMRGGNAQKASQLADRVAPQVLERPFGQTFALTGGGMEAKAGAGREAAGAALEAAGPMTGSTKIKPILDTLESLKTSEKHIVGGKVLNPQAVAHIDEVKGLIEQYGDVVPNQTLKEIKQGFDGVTYGKSGAIPNLTEGSLLHFKKAGSDTIRGTLAQASPDAAKLNAQYNFFSNFEEAMGYGNSRARPMGSLRSNLAMAAAGATGTSLTDAATRAAIVKALATTVESPAWNMVSGRVKKNLADAIASNNTKAILEITSKIGVTDSLQNTIEGELEANP